jgi:hypothetical protein
MLHSYQIVKNEYGQPFRSRKNSGSALVRTMESIGIRYRDPYNVRHS